MAFRKTAAIIFILGILTFLLSPTANADGEGMSSAPGDYTAEVMSDPILASAALDDIDWVLATNDWKLTDASIELAAILQDTDRTYNDHVRAYMDYWRKRGVGSNDPFFLDPGNNSPDAVAYRAVYQEYYSTP